MNSNSAPAAAPMFSRGLKAYTVGLLTLIYTANYVDRQIVAILLQSIKTDMDLSDTQLGLLTGPAFGVFYATLGIPIAYLADRMSRKKIIIASLSLFSVMTFVCGLAQNYVQLLLARVGVGVGEAGTSPPSHAIIADMYGPSERAAPLAVFALGINLGLFAAFIVGGYIGDTYGWRVAVQVVAIPGLALAILAWFTLRDPPRGMSDNKASGTAPPLRETLSYMWNTKSIRQLLIASTLVITVGYGAVAWLPSYFIRVHGMSATQVGGILAIMIGIGGGLGTAFGGVFADRLGKRDVRWNLWLVSAITIGVAPLSVIGYLSTDTMTALIWLAIPLTVGALYFGPTLAMLHTLVKPEMRSLASAIMLCVNNIIGLGVGPLSIGYLSDQFTPLYGPQGLGYALAAMTIVGLWGGIHYWMATLNLRDDIENAQTA
ncbi:MAG: MFS transporter [Alphaproteobacteria bacterium]|nr:MFS transporter [Alphaproteobacteria bacterium]